MVEVIGMIATISLIISMMFNAKNPKTVIMMRAINAVACVAFVIYGLLLSAYSTAISNGFIFFVDMWYLYKNILEYKKGGKDSGKV